MKDKKHIFLLTAWLVASVVLGQEFRSEEVTFANGEVTLAGTLSFPAGSPPYRAVVLVSGSGPQNRDSEVMGFKPFRLLADFFNRQGLAVLRYDDRGTGQSKGTAVMQSTTADLAEDARAAFVYLRNRKDIDGNKVGMLGHSEGGVVVPVVAASEPVAFAILMAGFGVKGMVLSNAQQAAILRASGMSEEFVQASNAMNNEVMDMMMREGVTEAQLTEFVKAETLKLLPLLPEPARAQITDPDAYANMAAYQAVAQSKVPWIRYYMTYDPLPILKKVTCPVLLLFGELDTQVLPSQNADLMKDALVQAGNKEVEVAVIAKANHLFQEAITGSPAEYASLKKEFIPGFLTSLEQWVRKR